MARHTHQVRADGISFPPPLLLLSWFITTLTLQVHQVLASDKVSSINRPLVRLHLHLKESPQQTTTTSNDRTVTREVSLELSEEELDALIAQLEVAKGALDKVKSAV